MISKCAFMRRFCICVMLILTSISLALSKVSYKPLLACLFSFGIFSVYEQRRTFYN